MALLFLLTMRSGNLVVAPKAVLSWLDSMLTLGF